MRRLTFDELSSVAFGAVEISPTPDGVQFFKCTKKQRDAWAAYGDWLLPRAVAPSGVRLDFYTDADVFAFDSDRGKYEVWVDDLLAARFFAEEQEGPIRVPLPEGDHRVTLIFPSHDTPGILKSVELSDGASLTPYRYVRRLLFLGDSITQGWDSDFDGLSYAWRVARFFDADALINGVGGGFFCKTTFDTPDFDPDAVVVALGTNDFNWFSTLTEARTRAAEFLDLVKAAYPDRPVFDILPLWRGDENRPHAMGTFAQLRAALREEGEKRGLIVVDGYELVPHLPEFYLSDQLHPNALGYSLYAENLIRRMLPYLKK